jgi:hypothetical protein
LLGHPLDILFIHGGIGLALLTFLLGLEIWQLFGILDVQMGFAIWRGVCEVLVRFVMRVQRLLLLLMYDFVQDVVLVVAVGNMSDKGAGAWEVVGTEEDRLSVPEL